MDDVEREPRGNAASPSARWSVLAALALAPLARAQDAEARTQDAGARGLVHASEEAFDGYTLFGPLSSPLVYLIDMDGAVVHTWDTGHPAAGEIQLLPNGNLLRCARKEGETRFHGGGIGGLVLEHDWDGKIVWRYELASEYQRAHHDLELLPNGHLLLIAWESIDRADAIEAGRDPAHTSAEGFWPDAVIEIAPKRPEGGEVVWEWHVWDHLIQDFDPEKRNYGHVAEHPELVDINADHRDEPPVSEEERKRREEREKQMRAVGYAGGDDPDDAGDADGAAAPGGAGKKELEPDWLHTNAVHYDAAHDLIALSVPHLGEVWILDHSTSTEDAAWHAGGRWKKGGDLLYRWGNPRNYGAGDRADQVLFYQHDVRFVPSASAGELRLLVFDNGAERPGGEHSSVEEIVLPFDPASGFARASGKPFGPERSAWSYSDPGKFFSPFISGAQRLPNGDTLICEGVSGRIFEVTRDGRIVWEYLNPYSGDLVESQISPTAPPTSLFRATRLAKDHPGLSGL